MFPGSRSGIDLSINPRDKFLNYSPKAYHPLEHQLQAVGFIVSNEAKTPQDMHPDLFFFSSFKREKKKIKYGICLLVVPVIVLHPRAVYQFKTCKGNRVLHMVVERAPNDPRRMPHTEIVFS